MQRAIRERLEPQDPAAILDNTAAAAQAPVQTLAAT
jgi:hypothetical protein